MRIARLASALWKLAVGILFCLTPLTGILVVGWLMRVMQRETAAAWHKQAAAGAADRSFRKFAADRAELRHLSSWPNWLLSQDAWNRLRGEWGSTPGIHRKIALVAAVAFGSLWRNGELGCRALLNVWTVTLPIGVLWLLAWWAGWENSFNKGYEQFFAGPLVASIGLLVFPLAMRYAVLALAHQAATGRPSAFFELTAIRNLRRTSPALSLLIAVLFLILGIPILFLTATPVFMEGVAADFVRWTPEEVEDFAQTYKLWAAAYLFPALVLLRRWTARIYAALARDMLKRSADPVAFAGCFPEGLSDLLLQANATRRHGGTPSAARRVGGRLARAAATLLALVVWLALAVQIFVAQFFNHAWITWLNHPLIHLPWLSSLP